MRITVPKDTAEEAGVYLRAWWDLRNGRGLERARRTVVALRWVSLVAGMALIAGVMLGWHPIAVGSAGIALGYAGAEAASLMSRLRTWPHNEKYLDWDQVRGALGEEDADGEPVSRT